MASGRSVRSGEVWTSFPGAAIRRAVGTPVFWGMLAASTIGIFMIPMLYVTFQSLRERVKAMLGMGQAVKPAQHPPS
mgnify:CR=1 FL=1